MKKSRRHALGQHFLVNRPLLRKIAAVVDPRPEDVIVEVGAGKGALTLVLAETAGQVLALEKDERLVPGLEAAVPANVRVIHADVLATDLGRLVGRRARGKAKIAGNIPYAISSPLLFKVLDAREVFAAAVFLVQKEVAERITARPGTKKFAPLSILLQDAFAARIEFGVSPGSFSPPPRVDSAVLSLRRRPAPLLDLGGDEELFRVFLRVIFAERRKTLRNNLSGTAPARAIDEAMAALGIDSRARSEQLDAETLASLFRRLRPELAPEGEPSRSPEEPEE